MWRKKERLIRRMATAPQRTDREPMPTEPGPISLRDLGRSGLLAKLAEMSRSRKTRERFNVR